MTYTSRAILAALIVLAVALWQPLPAQTQQANPSSAQPGQSQTPDRAASERSSPDRALPDRVLIDAYDAAQINGLVFISNNQTPSEQNLFGLRFVAYRQGGSLEESPTSFELGPHSPSMDEARQDDAKGSYAQISWQPKFDPSLKMTLRWSRMGGRMVIGQLSASANVRVAVEAYRPWNEAKDGLTWASYAAQPDRRAIWGEQIHNQKVKSSLSRFLWRADRAGIEFANYDGDAALRTMLAKGEPPSAKPLGARSLVTFELGPNMPLGFAAAIGEDLDAMQADVEKLMQKPVADLIAKAESDHEINRGLSGGALGDALTAINRATLWNRLYWPLQRYEYITPNRFTDRGLRGDALGWDSLLAAAATGLTDSAAATGSLRTLLGGQTPDGRIPLRRYLQQQPIDEPPVLAGRSMPPLGALAALKVYLITQDLEFLAWAYSRLQQWNDWWMANRGDGQAWRDGNKDGLLEWGFDAEVEYGAVGARILSNAEKRQLAFAESGFADRAQWPQSLNTESPKAAGAAQPVSSAEVKYNDQTHTLEMTSVALNSLYTLDTELMVSISREIGLTTEGDRWQRRYDDLKRLMNEKLWSEEDGLYLDRHWDGRFSRRITLESFYPLLAGIPDEAKAKRMLAALRDQKKFGGLLLLPFIARDDAAFTDKASEQTVATGATQAAANYLLYLGLKRYGFYDEAEGLARQSLHAAREAFEKRGEVGEGAVTAKGILPDLFASVGGQPITQPLSSRQASFPGLMFLPGLEELISADPWLGVTVGSLIAPEEAHLERIKVAGESLNVLLGPKRTVVRRGDKVEVEFEAPVRLRGYRSNERTLTFTVEAKGEVRALIPASEGRKVTVSVNDKVLGSTSPGASATFKVKEGLSRILIVR